MQPLRDHAIGMLLHHDAAGVQRNADIWVAREHAVWRVVRIREVEAALNRQRSICLVHKRVVWLAIRGAAKVAEELGVLLVGGRTLHPKRLLLVNRLVLAILVHIDGEVDVGRELLSSFFHRVHLRELGGIILQGEDNLGAPGHVGNLGDCVRAGAVRGPQVALVTLRRVASLRVDLDFVRDDESGVEADAELADDLARVRVAPLQEVQRPALCDGAEMGDELVVRHAHPCVLDRESALRLVDAQLDLQWQALIAHMVQLRCALHEAQLLASIGGVGDELADEDLLVGVERLRYDVQQFLRLSLELVRLGGARGAESPLRGHERDGEGASLQAALRTCRGRLMRPADQPGQPARAGS
mmetsp:Transcript_76811/g.222990  ORF Transcript_76811/g.222990 Transcript_76811/m.222990 type:complete len:357 (+) Transcript_76811:1210-2280(+)